MALKNIDMHDDFAGFLELCNFVFAAIFTVEMFLKLAAIGWSQYWRDGWNRFDFIIVIGTALGIVISATSDAEVGSVASIVRMFRIGRILRLTKSMPKMREIFEAVITSLPSMVNVMGLLGIFLFIFSALFVQLFAKLELKEDFGEHGNFQDFGVAALTLVRFLTGENWNGVLHHMVDWNDGESCEVDPDWQEDWCRATAEWRPNCRPLNGCGNRYTIYIFMYIYLVGAPLVVFNLFVGIVLEALSAQAEDGMLSGDNKENFLDIWAEFTEDTHLPVSKLKDFINDLHEPMGFGKEYDAGALELEDRIAAMDFNVVEANLPEEKGLDFDLEMKDIAEGLSRQVMMRKAQQEAEEDAQKEGDEAPAPAVIHWGNLDPKGASAGTLTAYRGSPTKHRA